MSQTLTISQLPDTGMPPNRKRMTREECNFLERGGFLTERYELLDGEIILKVGQNQPHAMSVSRLIFRLMGIFGPERVQMQTTIEVAAPDRETNRPEPDVMVFTRPDYELTGTRSEADLLLVAEVSDTTLRDDLRTKAALYARAGIPEYWVLDVIGRRLIIHLSPADGQYTQVLAYTEEETVASQAAPQASVRIADLLPPVTSDDQAGA